MVCPPPPPLPADEFELQRRMDVRRDFAIVSAARIEDADGTAAHVLCGASGISGLAWWRLPTDLGDGSACTDIARGGSTFLIASASQRPARITSLADCGPGRLAAAASDGTLRIFHLPSLATLSRVEAAHGPEAQPSFLLALTEGLALPSLPFNRAALWESSDEAAPGDAGSTANARLLSADVSGGVRRWSLGLPPESISTSTLPDSLVFSHGTVFALRAPAAAAAATAALRSGAGGLPSLATPAGQGGSPKPLPPPGPQQQQRIELWDVLDERIVAHLEAPPQSMAAPARLTVRVRESSPLQVRVWSRRRLLAHSATCGTRVCRRPRRETTRALRSSRWPAPIRPVLRFLRLAKPPSPKRPQPSRRAFGGFLSAKRRWPPQLPLQRRRRSARYRPSWTVESLQTQSRPSSGRARGSLWGPARAHSVPSAEASRRCRPDWPS